MSLKVIKSTYGFTLSRFLSEKMYKLFYHKVARKLCAFKDDCLHILDLSLNEILDFHCNYFELRLNVLIMYFFGILS